jgi:hypothetical protein
MQVVVVRCAEAEVAEFQLCTIATHFMANRIVLPFIDADEQPEEQRTQMKSTLGMLLPVQVLLYYLNAPCFLHPCAPHFSLQTKNERRGCFDCMVGWQACCDTVAGGPWGILHSLTQGGCMQRI